MYIKVKVVAGAKVEKVEIQKEDTWHVWVRVPAENNAANTRVLELIREMYPNVSVRIVSGHHSPSKIVSVG